MSEKRFTIFGEWHKDCVIDEIRDNAGEYVTIGRVVDLLNENEQLKQFPVKLDNRITKLQEDLQKLSKMDTSDLNPKAVEDVATVIGMSLNALLEFRKELNGDDVE